MTENVEQYFMEGCGRCPLGGTPDCKVHNWTSELALLRTTILANGLTETIKWGVPCYTINDKNVITLSALKDCCTISFFKGSLLDDPNGHLVKPGANSQAARYLKFTGVEEIRKLENDINSLIQHAIEVEKAGLQVRFKKNPEPIPEELQQRMEEDPVFKSAFLALTPGRQRGYIIHFSQPKQSKTRYARIDKWTAKILNGEGMHDKYKSTKK